MDQILQFHAQFPDDLEQDIIENRDSSIESVAKLVIRIAEIWATDLPRSRFSSGSGNIDSEVKKFVEPLVSLRKNIEVLLKMYAESLEGKIDPANMSRDWIIYTWVEVIFYYSVRLFGKHGIDNFVDENDELRKWVLNEMTDMEYVTLALLEGDLRTNDLPMKRAFDNLTEIRRK